MNKTKRLIGMIGLVVCGALPGYTSYGQSSLSVGVSVPLPGVQIRVESDFYEPLAPQGEWVAIGSYGRCWRPGHIARDWRPYCNGYWQRTDAGWYWYSNEPWGWATYHYGRWDFTDQYGWYWVPQTQWAPAWVSWHEGGGYIGWAPLLPSVSISVGGYVGFSQSRIQPRAYVFVKQAQFLDPIRPTTVVVNNTTIINKTTVISNTKIVNNTVINEGPATTVIAKASGRTVQAVPVQELRQKQEAAVVTTQRTPTTTSAQTAQTPASSQVQPGAKKTVAAPVQVQRPVAATPAPVKKPAVPEAAQIQKPVAATREFPAPAPKNIQAQSEKQKPVPAAPEFKPEARPEGNQPAANKQPTAQKTDKRVEKQQKPVKPSDQKAPEPAREKPAASEKNQPNPAAEKEHENKPKE